MKQPYTIDWEAIRDEINEEFAEFSTHETRLVDSYLMTLEEV